MCLNFQALVKLEHEVKTQKFQMILEMFITELAKRHQTIKQAYKATNFKILREEMHALKSAATLIGADNLSAICSKLEFAARDNDLCKVDELIGSFNSIQAETKLQLAEYIHTIDLSYKDSKQ